MMIRPLYSHAVIVSTAYIIGFRSNQRTLVDHLEGHVVGRQRDPAAFRPNSSATQSLAPTRRQVTAMVAGLVLVAGTVAVASFAVKPNKAQAFDLFYGSLFLNDERAPVAVDLTNGKPTVRLLDANTQVSAKKASDLDVVPLTNATLLLDTATGEFNMVDPSGFVIKTKNGGVPLPKRTGSTASAGIAAGASAYVVQTGPGGTAVYLVGQSTVQSATGLGAKVKPRAFATMTDPGSTAAGATASANGDLWLLVGSGGSRTVRQLTLPRRSDPGVTLASADRATVPGVSSIGVTTGRAGGDVVAVAAPGRVQVFHGSAEPRTLAVKGLSGVDRILPTSNQDDRLSFLYHSTTGWSLVSTLAGGGGLVGPATLRGVDPAAQLAAPAASNGQLFTMDVGATGRVWQIGPDGTVRTPAGVAQYPIVSNAAGKAVEVADFGDVYAIARGSRVVFDSPNHVRALALFTDNSHAPVFIDKSAAISLNAAGDATALTDPHPAKNRKTPPKKTAKVPAAQAVTDKVRCRNTTQVPHIPTITQATPGSRSVQLEWTYPLLDTHDCAPSTYTVSVRLLSSDAPAPPSSVTVQGQDGVNLTGLFPDTQYEITVSAYLNGRGTRSGPFRITTGPEGPAAPTNVHTTADSSGNWTVTWTSCGGTTQGCVASATWSVIPSFCDGSGLSSPPATISVAGDPTQHSFTAKFPGNDSILGRGLSFEVEGIGTKGTIGAPGHDNGCSYSWSPPVAGDISVAASSPPKTTGQATSATTVAVSFAGGQVHDLGGVGGQLTYTLVSGGRVVQQLGPVTATTVKLSGIKPGQHYQVSVVVSPPKHPEAAASVGPVDVTPAIATWPALSVSAAFTNGGVADGTLTVTMSGLASADARGETFDLADSNLICGGGNDVMPLEKFGFDPATPLTFPIDRSRFYGACSVTVQLAQDAQTATDPSVYGAGSSPAASSPQLTIDPPTLLGSTGTDFAATWSQQGTRADPQIIVSYNNRDPLLLLSATDWSMIVFNGATACGTANVKPTTTIHVPSSCAKAAGAFTVRITFAYFLAPPPPPGYYTVTVSGTAPPPIDATKLQFSASWSGSAVDPLVNIQYVQPQAYDQQTLNSLQWVETVTSNGKTCGLASSAPSTGPGGINVPVDYGTCPKSVTSGGTTTQSTYAVEISFTDPNYGTTGDYKPVITGTHP